MIRLLITVLLLTALAPTPALAQDDGVTAQERYDLCVKYKNRKFWTKALEQCQKVRNLHRDDPVSVLAELAIADIHFEKGDYEQARMYYEDFARLHPRHSKLDLVVYRTGLSIYKRAPKAAGRDQSATWQAVNFWTGYESRFPASEHLEDVANFRQTARNRLARKELHIASFYAKRGAWGATLGRAKAMIERYPDADSAPEAFVLAARAAHSWGLTDEALALRQRLAERDPDAPQLAVIDQLLERPPGSPPDQEIFRRPYRLSGGGSGAAMNAPM